MKKTGGVIVAAGEIKDHSNVSPLMTIGSISIIKRIVLTFQKAEVFPIVMVTGYQALELEQHLSDYGVIFIYNENYKDSEKFDSAKIGFDFIKDKCERVFFTSVTIPMYTTDTIIRLMESKKSLVCPSFQGKAGHPLLIDCKLLPFILSYSGENGMRGAIQQLEQEKYYLEVQDEGIVVEVENMDRVEQLLEDSNNQLIHPFVRVSIEKEALFFNARAKLLLLLIQETHSVKRACKHMALSYAKAWNMLNEMEETLGYSVVKRRQGGSRGGRTTLTTNGEEFLRKYEMYEEDVRNYAREHFYQVFEEFKKK